MAVSPDGHRVRERTRVHGTYLHADEQRASLHLRLPSANAAREFPTMLVHGGADGRNFVVSATPPPPLYLGAFDPGPDKAEAGPITLKIVRAGNGDDGVLGPVSDQRDSGKRTSAAVDEPDDLASTLSPVVEAIPSRQAVPARPGASQVEPRANCSGILPTSILRAWRRHRRRSHPAEATDCPRGRVARVVLRHNVLGSRVIRFKRSVIRRRYWPLPREYGWEGVLGDPTLQTVPEFERIHGPGTFSCKAAAPRKLLNACRREGIWIHRKGARVTEVLDRIEKLGGVPTTNAPPPSISVLPLKNWEMHWWDKGLTPERAARLLYEHGPCIGILWVTAEYHHFNADVDDAAVFRGETRGKGVLHDVVCFKYKFVGEELRIKVLDNHYTGGPKRWVAFLDTFDALVTVAVDPVSPACLLLRGRDILYPYSIT
ncbi:hypothetical protein C2845_PM03G00290 [Panicum miliaceum]|uniref:Uncharacterized protein n=1 Tax=Panicum miliaceum TaxID=4540 RepID=A0A3L6TAF2_PANMI|nr:hypothetical protein C2845_PM03G00290 [Panicum miliaceum]